MPTSSYCALLHRRFPVHRDYKSLRRKRQITRLSCMPSLCFFRLYHCMRSLIFIMMLGFASAALAQGSGSVQGQVMDPTGAVIPNANVVLAPKSGHAASNTSDGLGRFQFKSVPPGAYTLQVSAKNFSRFSSRITVLADKTVSVNPKLKIEVEEETVDVQAPANA